MHACVCVYDSGLVCALYESIYVCDCLHVYLHTCEYVQMTILANDGY